MIRVVRIADSESYSFSSSVRGSDPAIVYRTHADFLVSL